VDLKRWIAVAAPKARADRLGQGLRAVDDESRGTAGSSPRSMRLLMSDRTVAAFSAAQSLSAVIALKRQTASRRR
jgi:hypothetical protein